MTSSTGLAGGDEERRAMRAEVVEAALDGAANAAGDGFSEFLGWLDEAEEELNTVVGALRRADLIIRHASAAAEAIETNAPGTLAGWRRDEDETGQFTRRLDAVREHRRRLSGVPAGGWLTVPELASALDWNVKKTYRQLEHGRIPGARQPGGRGTEWLIPADAAHRYHAGA